MVRDANHTFDVEQGKVLSVRFCNVSGCVPRFEETMLEDGYMDMREI